ncbi:MAG: hypothetical protein AB8H03_23925 [Saprospiraceae bacterium]
MKSLLSLFFLFSCQSKKENTTFEKPILSVEDLVKHSEEFVTLEVIEGAVRSPKLAIAKGDLGIESEMSAFGELMGMFTERSK